LPNKQNIEVANDSDYYKVQTLKLIDWTALGKVTPIKNQGSICYSCYSFAAVALVESLNLIKISSPRIFSDQQMIDCTIPQGNQGCLVGSMENTFKYIQVNGIADSAAYPFTGSS
jgi:C1A family cysteine protease